MEGDLSFEAAAEEEPFRPGVGVELPRSAVEEEVRLRIREVAAEVHRGLPVVRAHQQ
jgi:hypothetical protein